MRQWDLTTGQCVMTMDILWAISHPPTVSSPGHSSSIFPGTAASIGTFAVPTPPYADGTWEMYQDFVGAVQFWGYALVSGSGDGAVRLWDSQCFSRPVATSIDVNTSRVVRTGQPHRTLLGHTAPVTCLQFNETHVVTGSLDKSLRVTVIPPMLEPWLTVPLTRFGTFVAVVYLKLSNMTMPLLGCNLTVERLLLLRGRIWSRYGKRRSLFSVPLLNHPPDL